MEAVKIGIFGGSGLYDLPGVKIIKEINVKTPFGKPSDKITIADFKGIRAAFLPRHGKGHRYLPSEIPARANVCAMKILGVEKLLSISAVGSLKEEIPPEDFVVPDQILDRTKGRVSTFFGKGLVGHVSFADPFCTQFSHQVFTVLSQSRQTTVHKGGTYLCMEGPAFSTRAESNFYRSLDCSVIGMTAVPEAKLAREAEMCFAMIAMSTDYDCWKVEEKPVTVEMVIKHMSNNTSRVKAALAEIVTKASALGTCSCQTAAKYAFITSPDAISKKAKQKLKPLYGKYFA